MKKSILLIIASTFLLTIFLSSCGNNATLQAVATATDTAGPTITITPTPDRCAQENIREEVDKVHRHMREFDDAAALASRMLYNQLSEPIANLQKIRREAEDEPVPTCLANLKKYQVDHMNLVIEVLLAFMSASNPEAAECITIETTEEQFICQNTALAGEMHDRYTLELARILGIPIITATAIVTPAATPTP